MVSDGGIEMFIRGWTGLVLIAVASTANLDAQVVDARTRRALEDARATVQLKSLDAQLSGLEMRANIDHQLVMAQAEQAMRVAEMQMAQIGPQLALAATAMQSADLQAAIGGIEFGFPFSTGSSFQRQLDRLEAAPSSLPQDPADSLWRAGREALNRGEFERAARLFSRIRAEDRFARSGYRADSYYWEAFALARTDQTEQLRTARDLLSRMREQYPAAQQIRDAEQLATAIDGRLARTGDAAAAEALYRAAAINQAATATTVASGRRADAARSGSRNNPQCPQNEEEDVRIAALSALLNVDSERTLPVLRDVLARRDECSAPLRRRALMLISRSRDPGASAVLVETARNDPDREVRHSAVMMLGSVRTAESTAALESILRDSQDTDVQTMALSALARQRGDASSALLRDYAQRQNVSIELRRQAVLMLMSKREGSTENAQFLRDLYGRTTDREIRQTILASLGRMKGPESAEWLMTIAVNPNEPIDIRRQALFTAGQSESLPVERLARLYDESTDVEFREQVLFTLARRNEAAALDKLIAIARTERDLEMRKKAIFWLGNSKDPRAAEALLELVRR
jgi:HEAT repeat protein